MIRNILTKTELKQLIISLDNLEKATRFETSTNSISGGFARASMFYYDNDYIDVELEWGVQSDCENYKHIEQYKINRKTWKIEE